MIAFDALIFPAMGVYMEGIEKINISGSTVLTVLRVDP